MAIKEKSAGAVIINEGKVLLLHYTGLKTDSVGYWDFPKGHIEKGETELETAKREVREETRMEEVARTLNRTTILTTGTTARMNTINCHLKKSMV